jgi:hypothetical protein
MGAHGDLLGGKGIKEGSCLRQKRGKILSAVLGLVGGITGTAHAGRSEAIIAKGKEKKEEEDQGSSYGIHVIHKASQWFSFLIIPPMGEKIKFFRLRRMIFPQGEHPIGEEVTYEEELRNRQARSGSDPFVSFAFVPSIAHGGDRSFGGADLTGWGTLPSGSLGTRGTPLRLL